MCSLPSFRVHNVLQGSDKVKLTELQIHKKQSFTAPSDSAISEKIREAVDFSELFDAANIYYSAGHKKVTVQTDEGGNQGVSCSENKQPALFYNFHNLGKNLLSFSIL